MHEDPAVPDTGRAGRGTPPREGPVHAIEPVFVAGGTDRHRLHADGSRVLTPP